MTTSTTMEMKRGDLKPDLVVIVTDADASFQSVSTWRILVTHPRGVLIDDTSPSVVVSADHHTATLTHVWVDGETDVAAQCNVEAEATWPDGSPQTFPRNGYLRVILYPDLG